MRRSSDDDAIKHAKDEAEKRGKTRNSCKYGLSFSRQYAHQHCSRRWGSVKGFAKLSTCLFYSVRRLLPSPPHAGNVNWRLLPKGNHMEPFMVFMRKCAWQFKLLHL